MIGPSILLRKRYPPFKSQTVKPTFTTKTQSRYADTKITKEILYFFFVSFVLLCDLCS